MTIGKKCLILVWDWALPSSAVTTKVGRALPEGRREVMTSHLAKPHK